MHKQNNLTLFYLQCQRNRAFWRGRTNVQLESSGNAGDDIADMNNFEHSVLFINFLDFNRLNQQIIFLTLTGLSFME